MFHIQRKSSTPLTEQIRQEFSDRIRSGILQSGTQLPSVRTLADTLNVSLVTVVNAYRLLEHEGIAEKIQGKGTFVGRPGGRRPMNGYNQDQGPNQHQGPNQDQGHAYGQPADPGRDPSHKAGSDLDWQLALADYLPRAAMFGQRSRSHFNEVPFKMSMASLNPDVSTDSLPESFYHVLQDTAILLSEYGPIAGMESLRGEIASYLRERGLRTHVDDILITNGVQQAIDIVARTFVGPGDVVAVEAPTYAGAIDVFRARGAVLVSIPMDDEGMRLDLLTKQCDKVPPKIIYTMPTFQNPTGIVMSARRRAQLLDLAESYHCLLVEDDSFADCSFVDSIPTPIKSLDKRGHVIYLKGFSKVFLSGCRVAAVVSSGSVHHRLVAAKSVSDLGSPMITQALVHACMLPPTR
ncbi:MAG: hypothetical protein A2201_07660, partial [Alicyclobacillus sp. RIFOXYA1_FULL_53_8]